MFSEHPGTSPKINFNCHEDSITVIEQDPRHQGRAPGFRQGQDRDKTDKEMTGTR